jgi:hypothetical protein
MVTQLLIAAGCIGDAGHSQRFDTESFEGDPVVWRRSVPHRFEWLNLAAMAMKANDYKITTVVTMRDWEAMARSQVAVGHVKTLEDARFNIRTAYREIFAQVQPRHMVAVYESLANPAAQRALLSRLGLPEVTMEIHDGNAKRWRNE